MIRICDGRAPQVAGTRRARRVALRSLFCWMLLAFQAAPSPIPAQEATLEDASWLGGCWLAASGGSRIQESWMQPDGGLMVGMSRTVRDGQAVGHEFILLRADRGGLVFTAHPSGQSPAEFRSVRVSGAALRFENPTHDFPKGIEYVRVGADSILAHVYGELSSSEPSFSLAYGRSGC